MRSSSTLRQNSIGLKLKEIFAGQLVLLDGLEYPGYFYQNETFQMGFRPKEDISPQSIKDYIAKHGVNLYIHHSDFRRLQDRLSERLVKLTRSLSIGDPLVNGPKQMNFLSLNMAALYENPLDDVKLIQQFKNTANLANFLISNKSLHKELYHQVKTQKHHFTIAQPLLSSLFLIGFLQELKVFSEKELQYLFIASYFKDIGMTFFQKDVLDKKELNARDKTGFQHHPQNSLHLLDGKVNLPTSYLNIIKNHHCLSLKQKGEQSQAHLLGVETVMLAAADILVAMISERPYRDPAKLFDALNEIKNLIADEYPQEFKALVHYIRYFYN